MTKFTTLVAAAIIALVGVLAVAPATGQDLTIVSTDTPLDIPGGGPGASSSSSRCGSQLGYLRRVHEAEIDRISRASVVPICLTSEYGLMRSDGNAGAIRKYLSSNEDVMTALDRTAFGVDDVVGVRITGDDTATIYVHPFHQ